MLLSFIERLTFEMTPVEKIVHQILYTRYTMVSAGMSIIPEIDGEDRFGRYHEIFQDHKDGHSQ